MSATSTSTLVRTTGSVKRTPMPVRLDLRSMRFSKDGRLYCQIIYGGRHVPVQQYLSLMVHDADIHRSCVKVDTAVELMVLCVESHKASSLGMDSYFGNYTAPPRGALMSIKSLELTDRQLFD